MNINNSNPIIENFISSFNLSADNHSLTIDVGKDENKILIDRFQRNRNIEDPAFTILTSMYSVLILLGALGNCLVVAAVLRKPVMRTARNTFIVNLAVSGKPTKETGTRFILIYFSFKLQICYYAW